MESVRAEARSAFRERLARVAGCALLAAALIAPAVAVAQGPVSTGKVVVGGQDQNWGVVYSNSSGTFTLPNAFVVTTPPSPPWLSNVSGSYQWISAASNGSVGNGPVSYTFFTTFSLGAFNPSSVSVVFRCAVDNGFVGYSLNGGPTASAGCGSQANGYQFGATQTLSSGFVSGANTLKFFSTGDGTTDGLVVSVDAVRGTSTVPEPSSLGLLATGFAGLVPMMRRRGR